jgi:hypothetical protein
MTQAQFISSSLKRTFTQQCYDQEEEEEEEEQEQKLAPPIRVSAAVNQYAPKHRPTEQQSVHYTWKYLESVNVRRQTCRVAWEDGSVTHEPLSAVFHSGVKLQARNFHISLARKSKSEKEQWLRDHPGSGGGKGTERPLRDVMPIDEDELPVLLVSAANAWVDRIVSNFKNDTKLVVQKWDQRSRLTVKLCTRAKALLLFYHSSDEDGGATHPITGALIDHQTTVLSSYLDESRKSLPNLEFVFILTCAYNLIQLDALKQFSVDHPTLAFFYLQREELYLYEAGTGKGTSSLLLITQLISNCLRSPETSPLEHAANVFDHDPTISLYRPFFLYQGQQILVARDLNRWYRCVQCGGTMGHFIRMDRASRRLSEMKTKKKGWTGWRASCKENKDGECPNVFFGPGKKEEKGDLTRGESTAGSVSFASRLDDVSGV